MGYGLELSSGVADGGVANILDTDAAFTSGTLLSVRNNSSEKFAVDFEGAVTAHDVAVGGALTVAETTVITGHLTGANAAGPAVQNEAATATNPTLVPDKADLDTGVGWSSADVLSLVAGGVAGITITEAAGAITTALVGSVTVGTKIEGTNAAGPAFLNEAATATNPTLCPDKADPDTGLGWASSGFVSVVCDGAQAGGFEDPADLGASETSLWLYDDDNDAVQQVSVGADDSGGAGYKLLRIAN
jgi:hypothetical protein